MHQGRVLVDVLLMQAHPSQSLRGAGSLEKKTRKIKESDRLFSLSSCTAPQVFNHSHSRSYLSSCCIMRALARSYVCILCIPPSCAPPPHPLIKNDLLFIQPSHEQAGLVVGSPLSANGMGGPTSSTYPLVGVGGGMGALMFSAPPSETTEGSAAEDSGKLAAWVKKER